MNTLIIYIVLRSGDSEIACLQNTMKKTRFSHIKKDLSFHVPHFSKTVLWNPEDLIPVPIPKQDFLPLPPGIPPVASQDPRLSRVQQQVHTAPPAPPAPVEHGQSSSSSLPDFELLSRILKTVNSSPSPSQNSPTGVVSTAPSAPPSAHPVQPEKPVDPRMARKVTADPRLQHQKSALKPPSESTAPQPAQSASPSRPPPPSAPTTAPYDPRLLSAGGVGRAGAGVTGTSSNVLSSISLYDPRTAESSESSGQTTNSASSAEPKASTADVVVKAKPKEPLFVRKSPLDAPDTERGPNEPPTDRYNSYNRPRPKPSPSPGTPGGSTATTTGLEQQLPGVHNLPVSSSLFHMVKQVSKPGSGSPFGGNSPAQLDTSEQDAASLKDVFKGFDPTASPFCQ